MDVKRWIKIQILIIKRWSVSNIFELNFLSWKAGLKDVWENPQLRQR